jgi:enoyl-CoA hydratase/carnithine racemase
MSEFVKLSRQGGVACLTLDRPQARNALTWEMWRAISRHLAALTADAAVKAVILQGGRGCFAAGADIDEMGRLAEDPAEAARFAADMVGAMEALARFAKPTIAAIQGACIGGGMTLALACDMRFAGSGARLGITPARLGLVPPLADSARLIDIVGVSAAKDLLFSARLVDAEEALRLGLIDRLLADDEVAAAALAYAGQLAALSQHSIAGIKRMIARALGGRRSDDDETMGEFVAALTGEDFREGRAAFLQKRQPEFPSR